VDNAGCFFPLTAIVAQLSKSSHADTATLSGKILTVVMARPAPLILLILGIFYLWVYVRGTGQDIERDSRGPEGLALASGRGSGEILLFAMPESAASASQGINSR
jgi:hypothetical protein